MTMQITVIVGLAIVAGAAGTAAIADDARTPIYPAGNVPIAPYSPGVQVTNGMLFVSGQIAYVDGAIPDHAKDGKDDVADQTRIVMENLRTVLDEAGYTFDDAVRATVFMTDINNYGAINEVYGTYWGEGKIPPARAAVEVSALPGGKPDAPVLLEISMIAAK
ncbi:MAG: Rid family hydrolase [Pseudomonadota bacterium]